MAFRTVELREDRVVLLDQTRLPREVRYVELFTVEEVARAIETMVVRGAPAIGITAAFGIALAARRGEPLDRADDRLRHTRPTAVNLFWALDRLRRLWEGGATAAAIAAEARAIYEEDAEASRLIGEHGARLIPDRATILTHCNAGALATAELGTALAVIRAAHAQGKQIKVFADETRPLFQGARLTAWELMQDGIDVTLIPDGAAAHFIGRGEIDCAVVGADRIARNGDVANKIGTRGIAGHLHLAGRPLYVAAPWSTVDLSKPNGAAIPIEEREPREVTHLGEIAIAPDGVRVRNPAFDITPATWIAGIITELGFTGRAVAAGLASQGAVAERRPR